MATKKSNKSLSETNVRQLVIASILIVLGVLFCVSLAALDIINIIIGAAFIVVGAVLLILEVIKNKSLVTGSGIFGGLLIAFGIAIIIGQLLGVLVSFLILVLIVLGAILIVDSVLLIAVRNKKNVTGFVIELMIGIVAFVLGMCLWFIPEFQRFANLIFGIVLIFYGAYLIVDVIVRKK